MDIAKLLAQRQEAHEAQRLGGHAQAQGQSGTGMGVARQSHNRFAVQNHWAQTADPQLAAGQVDMPSWSNGMPNMQLGASMVPEPAAHFSNQPIEGLWYSAPREQKAMGNKGPPLASDQVFTGKVKWYEAHKGFGVIESPEATAMIGENVPLLKSELMGVVPEEGDTLSFQLGTNKATANRSANNKFRNAYKAVNITFFNAASAVARDAKVQASIGLVFPGLVNQFDQVKGLGYISCPTLWDGCSLKFHVTQCRDALNLYGVGQQCYFTLALGDSVSVPRVAAGVPVATNVYVGAMPGQPGSTSSSGQAQGTPASLDSGGGSGPIRRKSKWDDRASPY